MHFFEFLVFLVLSLFLLLVLLLLQLLALILNNDLVAGHHNEIQQLRHTRPLLLVLPESIGNKVFELLGVLLSQWFCLLAADIDS